MRKVVIINIKRKHEKNNNTTLFEIFNLGDRLNCIYVNKDGKKDKYSGIVMAISKDNIEVFWDKINGIYKPEKIHFTFNTLEIDEIINGNQEFSKIKKNKYIY